MVDFSDIPLGEAGGGGDSFFWWGGSKSNRPDDKFPTGRWLRESAASLSAIDGFHDLVHHTCEQHLGKAAYEAAKGDIDAILSRSTDAITQDARDVLKRKLQNIVEKLPEEKRPGLSDALHSASEKLFSRLEKISDVGAPEKAFNVGNRIQTSFCTAKTFGKGIKIGVGALGATGMVDGVRRTFSPPSYPLKTVTFPANVSEAEKERDLHQVHRRNIREKVSDVLLGTTETALSSAVLYAALVHGGKTPPMGL